jgi:hypothetical protein
MDSYSILTQSAPDGGGLGHESSEPQIPSGPSSAAVPLRATPAGSLIDQAERDLHASLQLLASRMQCLTGASAATIAFREAGEMLGRASAGPMAAEPGAQLRTDPTLVNQSTESRQIVCCNDTTKGAREDGSDYAALGIKSMMVMPLLRESEAVGMLELLADRSGAFDDEDGAALERLSGLILTAVEHFDAAKRAPTDIPVATPCCEESQSALTLSSTAAEPSQSKELHQLRSCDACGFPVSAGRTLCVDCEAGRPPEEESGAAPAFLFDLIREQKRGWLQSHFYTLGTVLMVLLTVVALLLKLR